MAASRIHDRDPFAGGLPQLVASPNPSLLHRNNNSDEPVDSEDGGPVPSDRELMKLMMARLAIMEQKVQKQDRELVEKNRRIKVLEDKLRIISKARGLDPIDKGDNQDKADDIANLNQNTNGGSRSTVSGESGNSSSPTVSTYPAYKGESSRVAELEKHCLVLQQQVHEMETFLADYGMVWVGDQDHPDANVYHQEDQRMEESRVRLELDDWNKAPEATHGQPFKINFNMLLANIRDLNVIAGEGEAKVIRTLDGARLVRPDPIPLTLYSNGMIMFEGPFRLYTEAATVQCIQDLLDGYFPSELQYKFPDGVPFAVQDMRDVYFQPRKATTIFTGSGQMLGGAEQPSRLVPSFPLRDALPLPDGYGYSSMTSMKTNTFACNDNVNMTSNPPHRQLSSEQFLNKLPKSVVRDGKVIDIRDSIGRTLTGQNNSTGGQEKLHITVVETAVTKAIQKTIAQPHADRPKTPRDITTLRIKSESGTHTYILKMRFHETVGDLRKYLNKHRVGQSTEYEIYSTYPRKQFSDDSTTMDGCGLVPNGVLYLRPQKKE